jgi:hypothetical protein
MLGSVAISAMLGEVAKKALPALGEKLAGKVSEELLTKLRGEPARTAFKRSLASAIERYATGERFSLREWLLNKDSILTRTDVAIEIGQTVRLDREPDVLLIGQWWKRTFADLLPNRDYNREAKLFLSYLREELRETEVFRPVFEQKSLDAIAEGSGASTQALIAIEKQLASLTELVGSRFSDLTKTFAKAPPNVRNHVRDFTAFIQDRTRDFVGRKSVFDEIDKFVRHEGSGYILVSGDPGIGKSAVAAQLIKANGYVHHFNIRAEGINTPEAFLQNVCAQLISAYDLAYSNLPSDATHDSRFLNKLFSDVKAKKQSNQKVVVIIDGLDEVDPLGLKPGVNPLFLPVILENGIFILLTLRRNTPKPRMECKFHEVVLEHDSSSNMADIEAYVHRSTDRPGIQAYLAAQGISHAVFVQHLCEKSQGNFMYLRYVLPEIENGGYADMEPRALPAGLKNYYDDHWRRMRNQDEEIWFKYKLPVVMVLTAVKVPVSVDLIAKFSGVSEIPRIRSVLQEWGQFLHEEVVDEHNGLQRRYRVYHESFHEFIAAKEEVADERVNLRDVHGRIADELWEGFFGAE